MPDILSRLNAALTDRYAIERPLGEGGMATVYLARDLKHNRHVALKVLKPELAAVVGAERFLAEIETTANLQHPDILPLYDSGEADSFLYYVMPYVEGETLRDRLDREKQLPVDEAVRIATAVANALDFAHGHRVVHRDIKPANILFQAGQPVVGDFGVALAVGAGGGARLTETGLSVGTPYYMSPEQATGDQQVGPRSDIYSLGCVLYEMLVGDPPYLGSSAQAVLGQIIAGKPVKATEKRSAVPANVDAAIRKALEKVPADRFATAAELAAALANPAFRYGADDTRAAPATLRRWKAAALAAGVVAVAAVAAGRAGLLGPTPPAPRVLRQDIRLSSLSLGQGWERSMAIGPHGGIVYEDSAGGGGAVQLFYKAPDAARGTPIPGTEHPVSVSFSPTGDSIAFTQAVPGRPSKLIVLPLAGGVANTIATDADIGGEGGGLDWLDDGTILYETEAGAATPSGATISRVPADGNHPSEIVVKNQFSEAAWVQGMAASEKALVIYNDTLWVADLRTGAVSPQMGSVARAWYFPPRYVIYVLRDGSVFATRYNDKTGALEGGGVRLFEGVRIEPDGEPDMALGKDGTLIYASGGAVEGGSWSLAWLDRKGAVQPLHTPTFTADQVFTLALSPHDRRVAFAAERGQYSDIMVAGLPSGPITTLTPGGGDYRNPMWSRDGRFVLFSGQSGDTARILRMRSDGSTPRMDTLLSASGSIVTARLTPDAGGVVYSRAASGRSFDLHYARFGSDSTATLRTPGSVDFSPSVSPDGRWLAYLSIESDRSRRIFVRPFPDWTESRVQVSLGDLVSFPFWSRNRDELFYVAAPDTMLMAASFRTSSGLEVASRTPLFKLTRAISGILFSIDVDATGDRFLVAKRAQSKAGGRGSLFMVLNWAEEVRARLRGSD